MAKFSVEPPDGGWGWVVVASSFVITFLSFGTSYSIEIFFDILMEEFDSSKSAVSAIASIALSLQCLLGPFVGILEQRFQAKPVVFVGCFLISLAFITSAYAPNVACLYFTFGIVGGIGMAMTYLPMVVLISTYFNRRRTLATALGGFGAYVGVFVHPYLLRYLISLITWRGALFITGALILNSLAGALLLRPVEESQKQEEKSRTRPQLEANMFSIISDSKSPNNNNNNNGAAVEEDNFVEWPTASSRDSSGWPSKMSVHPFHPKFNNHLIWEGSKSNSNNKTNTVINRPPFLLNSRYYDTGGYSAPISLAGSRNKDISGFEFGIMSMPSTPVTIEKVKFQEHFFNKSKMKITTSEEKARESNYNSLSSVYNSALIVILNNNRTPPPSIRSSANEIALSPLLKTPPESPGAQVVEVVTSSSETSSLTTSSSDNSLIKNCFIRLIIRNPLFLHFKNQQFLALIASSFLNCLAFYTPAMFLVDWCHQLGIETWKSTILLSLIGVGNIVGRPIMAFISDTYANCRVRLYAALIGLAGLVTVIIPTFASFPSLAVFVFEFAFLTGGSQTLVTPILADIFPLDELPSALGVLLSTQGVALLIGPPLLGLLPTYNLTFLASGLTMLISSCSLLIAHYCQTNNNYKNRKNTESISSSSQQ